MSNPGNCLITQDEVVEALLAAQPLLAREILDLTLKTPDFLRDIAATEEFPRGQGTSQQQIIVRGAMPPIERGFAKWNKLNNNAGCEPCEGPDCSYNWTMFGGLGLEKRLFTLMDRDFRSQSYCVKNIQTTAHFKEFFGQIVKNLFSQIAFFKAQNINFNYFTSLAKKYVVDSSGPRPNTANPYVYPPIGTATISSLNIDLLTEFYEYMRLDTSVIPYDIVDGSPVFSAIASPQLLARLYRNDPQLRQDVRFSGLANDLVTKYNFMSTFRGMFINAPILFPRRFRWDATVGVAGDWVEVLPFSNGIPMEIGSFTGLNPQWVDPGYATHEEVILHGKSPFKIMYMPTETTLGNNTSFGPEQSYMDTWQWVNTLTDTDPGRRVGYFWTSATIALAPQYSTGIYGILVARDPLSLTFTQSPQPTCPVDPVDCGNTIPDTDCPCQLVLTSQVNGISGNVQLTLASPLDPVPAVDEDINFAIDTGGFIVGNVEDVNDEGNIVEVSFPDGTDLGVCDHFISVFCENTLLCSASVQSQCVTSATNMTVVLSNNLKAYTSGDTVTITFTDGTTADVTLAADANQSTLTYVLANVGSNLQFGCNDVGIVSICVPPGTDPSCPDCGGPTYTQCAS